MQKYMLKVDNIEAIYMNVIQVLKGLSLEVGDGEIIGLLGSNGAGKTTTIRGIIDLFFKMGMRISLSAPTGRAAKKLEETTGRESKTIHRLCAMETGAKLFEISTSEVEDVIRLDDDYGRIK